MTRISNSLESVAAFDASLPEVVDSLGAFLGRFGEVKREERQGFEGVLGWLLPLTSFASRYVVLSWTQEWTIVLKNARELAQSIKLMWSLDERSAERSMLAGQPAAVSGEFLIVERRLVRLSVTTKETGGVGTRKASLCHLRISRSTAGGANETVSLRVPCIATLQRLLER